MGHDTIVVRRKCLGVCRKSLFLILSSYSFPCSAWERYSGAPRQMSLPFSCAERRIGVPTETVGTRNSHNRYLQSRCSMVVVHFLLLVQKKTNQKSRPAGSRIMYTTIMSEREKGRPAKIVSTRLGSSTVPFCMKKAIFKVSRTAGSENRLPVPCSYSLQQNGTPFLQGGFKLSRYPFDSL